MNPFIAAGELFRLGTEDGAHMKERRLDFLSVFTRLDVVERYVSTHTGIHIA